MASTDLVTEGQIDALVAAIVEDVNSVRGGGGGASTGQIDGGTPSSIYGGAPPVDGGTP